jgi:hypothetical protein
MNMTIARGLLCAACAGLPLTLHAETSALSRHLGSAPPAWEEPPAVPRIAAAAPKTGTTAEFEGLRARFSDAGRPAPADLRPREKWTCYSLVNNRGGENAAAVDEQAFDEFGGRVFGRRPRAPEVLEFRRNPGGWYAAYRGGRGGKMVVAEVYRLEADGSLIRETAILYDTVFPLNHPAGITLTPSRGIPAEDVERLVGMRAASAVFSYATCVTGR